MVDTENKRVDPIVVKITWIELFETPNIQMHILAKLHEAGIPIKGICLFQGVERGTLTEEMSFDERVLVYTWREE